MSIIVLIPAIFCLIAVYRQGTARAFLNVCIPVLALLPTYGIWKIAYLPPLGFMEAALVPLGIGMLVKDRFRWKWTRTDLWMGLFLVSGGYTHFAHGETTPAIFRIFSVIATAVFPYMAGKLLIEQAGARVRVAKRFIWLVFLGCLPALYEFPMKQNLYRNNWGRIFPSVYGQWVTQIRWGFGRVAGPYGQSELGGMILLMALILSLWMSRWGYWERRFKLLPQLPFAKQSLIAFILVGTLYAGQARGPWLGAIFGCIIAYTGRSRSIVRSAIIVGVLLAVTGAVTYTVGQQYVEAPTQSSEQQTAQYRHDLVKHYTPIAKYGGAWGWGENFPLVYGQVSIDNEYLLVWLQQGYMGVAALLFLMLETFLGMARAGFSAKSLEDQHFAFTLLGIFLGIALTLGTVFLGSQAYELFFVLVGWSQVLVATVKAASDKAAPERSLKVELIRVYT